MISKRTTDMKDTPLHPDPSNGRYPYDAVNELIERHLSDILSEEAPPDDDAPPTTDTPSADAPHK